MTGIQGQTKVIGLRHEVDYDIVSKSIHNSLAIRGYCFSALISLKSMCLNNSQNVGNLPLIVFSHVVVKMTESFAANTVSHFRCPKQGKKNQSCFEGVFITQLPTERKSLLNFFANRRSIEKLKVLYLIPVAI